MPGLRTEVAHLEIRLRSHHRQAALEADRLLDLVAGRRGFCALQRRQTLVRIGQAGLGLAGQPETGAREGQDDGNDEGSDDRLHESLLRELPEIGHGQLKR